MICPLRPKSFNLILFDVVGVQDEGTNRLYLALGLRLGCSTPSRHLKLNCFVLLGAQVSPLLIW